jgi:hypothetical protein
MSLGWNAWRRSGRTRRDMVYTVLTFTATLGTLLLALWLS